MKKVCAAAGAAICAVVLIMLFCGFNVLAYDTPEEESIAAVTGADSLSESPYIDEEEQSGDRETDIFGKIFSIIGETLTGVFKSCASFFFSLIAVTVISAVLASFGQTSDNQSLRTVYGFVSVLTLSGVLFAGLKPVFAYAAESLDRLCIYMASLLPVTASLYAAGGNVSQGVAGSSSLLLFLTVTERFAGGVLNPMLQAGFVLSVASALPGSVDMRSMTNFIKNALTSLLAFAFTVFGVVMYFQTVIAASADSYMFRTVKFASGVFIPVIGSVIGDAARTVAAAVGVVKASVGAIGLVTVAGLTLPPIIYTVMFKLTVLAAAMTARMLGLEKESLMLYDVNAFMSVLMSVLIGTGIIFVIAVAMFIRIGVEA